MENDDDKNLVGYRDTSFVIPDEKKFSVTGNITLFGGAPIYWVSKRQHIANRSIMDSELITTRISRYRNLLKNLIIMYQDQLLYMKIIKNYVCHYLVKNLIKDMLT